MTKKSLFLLSVSTFFLINQGAFAWGSFDTTGTTYYTYNNDLPSIYDGYTLRSDNRMVDGHLASYSNYQNTCEETVNRNLSLGSSGEDVATVQDYLYDQDFLHAQPNGYFGYATKNAVKLFQSRYGIASTGTVGPKTMSLLNNLICSNGSSVSASTVSRVTEIAPTQTYQNQNAYPVSTISNVSNGNIVPVYTPNQNSVIYNGNTYNNNNQMINPVIVNRAPTMTIVIPLNKSVYNEGDTIPANWVVSNMNPNRFAVILTNTSTGLEKRIAALPGDMRSYNVTLTKEILDGVCAGSTACSGINSKSYRLYIIGYYQTGEGEAALKAYADEMTVNRPLAVGQVILTPSKNPVSAGETINLQGYIPNSPVFNQYTNLYWKVRADCQPGVTLTINGISCGGDVYVYQANKNISPEITVQVGGNMWGPTEVTFSATVLSYYGGQELGRATTKILVNK